MLCAAVDVIRVMATMVLCVQTGHESYLVFQGNYSFSPDSLIVPAVGIVACDIKCMHG